MQKIIFSLLALISGSRAYAQIQPQNSPCSNPDEMLICTTLFEYDAAGNRTLRKEVCACGMPQNRPAARTRQPFTENTAASPSPSRGGEMSSTAIARLYPNPATTSIRVVFSGNLSAESVLTLTNAQGSQVAQITLAAGTTEADIPLSGYAAGVYIAQLHNGNALRFVKVE